MALNDLNDLFVDELKDIYDAEQRITKALPKMAKAASSEELVSAFKSHLEETKRHVTRLESIFETIGESPAKKSCKAMMGLLEEGEEIMKEDAEESVKDAALIAAAQKVEHYEMATYGCLRDWARLMDLDEAVELLQQTLDEEADADRKLSKIAQALNVAAIDGDDEEERETVRPAAARSRAR